MRVAIVADTHLPRGARTLPASLLAICGAADLIVHAGDFTAHEVLIDLEALAPVAAVHGNCDDADLVHLLPAERVVETAGVRLGIVHDSGPADGRMGRLRARFPGCDAVVFGHSHLPLMERADDLLLLNPGSPTERRRAPTCTMAIAEIADGRVTARIVDV